jgi:putative transposase
LYNAALEKRRGAWRLERRPVTRFEQYKTLTGLASDEPTLMAFGVTVARGTLLRLDRAFQAFFRRAKTGEAPGYPRFRSVRRFNSAEWPDIQGWKLDEAASRLYLQGIGHVKLRMHRSLRGTPKTITVVRTGTRWQLNVYCSDVAPRKLHASGNAVGIDVGVNSAIATSDGRLVDNPRHLQRAAAAIARTQRRLARQERESKRRANTRDALARLQRRVANQRRDFLHKQSRVLINQYDLVVIEDLKVAAMTRRPHPVSNGSGGFAPNGAAAKAGLNSSILDVAWARFRSMLSYKAEEAGRELLVVNPRFTSQRCASCGDTRPENRTGTQFRCVACGHEENADVNAAVNILRAGLAQRLERDAKRVVA